MEILVICPNCEENEGEWIIQGNWFTCPVCGEIYLKEEITEIST